MTSGNKKTFVVIVLILVGLGTFKLYTLNNSINTEQDPIPVTNEESPISVDSPKPDTTITSPISVSGTARGMWYFEASFPVQVYDANGKLLGSSPAAAQGEWMTENFVPFTGVIEFSKPETKNGTVVFKKDNPSGMPEHDASYIVPVKF
jgi:hypothetical protein